MEGQRTIWHSDIIVKHHPLLAIHEILHAVDAAQLQDGIAHCRLEQHGMRFAGMSPDGVLPETIEYQDHPWFIGVQYHPELKSRPFEPHPLFSSFIGAAVERSRLV